MSWWDHVKNDVLQKKNIPILGPFLPGSAPQGGGSGFGTFKDITTNAATSTGGAVLPDQAQSVLHPVAQGLDWAQTNLISRPLSTALLEFGPVTGGTLGDTGKLFDGDTWGHSWRDSKFISPGQAAIADAQDLTGLGAGWKGGVLRPQLVVDPNTGATKTVLPYFDHGWGQTLSGATDAAVNLKLFPLAIAGNVGKGIRLSQRGVVDESIASGPIQRAVVRRNIVKQKAGVEAGLDGDFASTQAHELKSIVESAAVTPWATHYTNILAKPWVGSATNPEVYASALSKADSYEDIADVYLASLGLAGQTAETDPLLRLAARHGSADIANQLASAQEALKASRATLKTMHDVDADTGTISWAWDAAQDEMLRAADEVSALTKRKSFLDTVLNERTGSSIRGSAASNPIANAEWLNTIDEARATRRAKRLFGGWRDETYYSGPFSTLVTAPVRTSNYLRARQPIGVVALDGPATANMTHEITGWAREVGLSEALTRHHVALYGRATTPEERLGAVQALKEAGISKLAADVGDEASAKVIGKRIAEMHLSATLGPAQQMRKTGGYFYDPEKKAMVKAPWLETHGADVAPLPSAKDISSVLNDHSQHLGDLIPGAKAAAHHTNMVLGALSDIWRVGVLFHLGYGTRNVMQNLLDSWIGTGVVPIHPISGVGNLANNGYSGVRNRFIRRTRAGILQDIDHAVENRAAIAEDRKLIEGQFTLEPAATNPVESNLPRKAEYQATLDKRGSQVLNASVIRKALNQNRGLTLSANQQKRYLELLTADSKGLLTAELEPELARLHAKAARSLLRTAHKNGLAIGVKGEDGATVLVKKIDETTMPDEVLFPSRDVTGARPEPEVYVAPKFRRAAGDEIKVGKRLNDQVAADARMTKENPAAVLDRVYTEQQAADLASHEDMLREIDAQIAGLREQLVKNTPSVKARVGQGRVVTDRLGLETDEAFGGTYAPTARANSSVEQTTEITRTTLRANLAHRAMGRILRRAENQVTFEPNDPDYFQTLTYAINHWYGNSAITRPMMEGHDIPEVAAMVKANTAVMDSLDLGKLDDDEFLDVIARAYERLNTDIPDKALQLAAVTGKGITEDDVVNALKGRTDLNPISGENVQATLYPRTMGGGLGEAIDWFDHNLTRRAFKYLNVLPENAMVAWPFYDAMFKARLNHLINVNADAWIADGVTKSEANRILEQKFRPAAHQYALSQTKKVLYRVDRKYALAGKLSYLTPFLQVAMNRSAFYGGQLVENPQRLALIMLGWQSVGTHKNADGQSVLTLDLPSSVSQHLNLPKDFGLQFNKQSFNIMFSGQPAWSPGFGPSVTVPVSYLLRQDPNDVPPELAGLVRTLQSPKAQGVVNVLDPYPKSTALQDVAPAFVTAWMQKEDTPQWAANFGKIFAYEQMKYDRDQALPIDQREGIKQPTFESVRKQTDGVWLFRVLTRAVSPVQPSVQTPLQPMIDSYYSFLQTYGDTSPTQKQAFDTYNLTHPGNEVSFSAYQRANGPDAQFLAKHPEAYKYVTFAINSDPTGVQGQQAAQDVIDANGNLAQSLGTLDPRLVGLMANDPSDLSQANKYVRAYQNNRPVTPGSDILEREDRAGGSQLAKRNAALGWQQYAAAKSQVDAILAERAAQGGSADLSASTNTKLNAAWKQFRDNLFQSNEDFQNAYNTHDDGHWYKAAQGVAMLAASDLKTADSWRDSAKLWIAARNQVERVLLDRSKQPGGSADLTAKSNTNLKKAFDTYNAQLVAANPAWGDVFNSYLDGDTIFEATQENP